MIHISIQNALQNHYLGAEDRHISEAEGPRDETTVQNTDLSLYHLEDRTLPQSAEGSRNETTVQNTDSSLHHLEDPTLAQSINLTIHHTEERTISQYADSAIYRPADQTTAQLLVSIPNRPEDQTICQQNAQHIQQEGVLLAKPKNSIQGQTFQHNILRMKDSFSARLAQLSGQFLSSIRKIADFKQKGSNPTRQFMAVGTSKTLTSPVQDNRLLLHGIAAEVQPSQEEYQKVLRELDHCRLSFAKELARNGKLRDAIALANKIPETSRFFRDAQTLARSWKQL